MTILSQFRNPLISSLTNVNTECSPLKECHWGFESLNLWLPVSALLSKKEQEGRISVILFSRENMDSVFANLTCLRVCMHVTLMRTMEWESSGGLLHP